MRLTQRALGQIEQRIDLLSHPAIQPPPQQNPAPENGDSEPSGTAGPKLERRVGER
jgi:hypothetical protein